MDGCRRGTDRGFYVAKLGGRVALRPPQWEGRGAFEVAGRFELQFHFRLVLLAYGLPQSVSVK